MFARFMLVEGFRGAFSEVKTCALKSNQEKFAVKIIAKKVRENTKRRGEGGREEYAIG